MADVQFSTFNAFDDAKDSGNGEEKVHVRVQQRICKAFKKNFSCNGAVQKDEEVGEVIQLSGDQRTNVQEFLVDQEICLKDSIILHGF
ncbi:hypothetical protein TrRE_jg8791 [Triparma retinervis]|uniref:SUI1 domain-containing protein n=1 Tax=Triparma retinervis TaxID=2557542 RepID=A0A9W7DRL8_9STRA|nr:hypothetical protein TrRE_jg8791 [Triparma retinervis]